MIHLKSIPLKYWLILAAVIALGVFVYMWRSEIIKGAESACMAAIGQKTIEANNQSRKNADEVRKDEQSRTKRDVVNGLSNLGILRPDNDSE